MLFLLDKSGKVTPLFVGRRLPRRRRKGCSVAIFGREVGKKDNKWYPTVDETKDSLKSAEGYKYDSSTTTWKPDTK